MHARIGHIRSLHFSLPRHIHLYYVFALSVLGYVSQAYVVPPGGQRAERACLQTIDGQIASCYTECYL
eukprot:3148588-Pyramimonas_sp.AAC.1